MSSKTFGRPPYADMTSEHAELASEHDDIEDDVIMIEGYIHAKEHWLGKSADQSGNDWGADTLTPFQAVSGNGVYGADADDEAKILGTADTPIIIGFTSFAMHRILLVGVSQNSVYKLRIVWGTGTMADAITALQVSEFMIKFDALNPQQSAGIPFDVKMPQLAAQTKIWVQCKNVTDNATVDFFVGLHEHI